MIQAALEPERRLNGVGRFACMTHCFPGAAKPPSKDVEQIALLRRDTVLYGLSAKFRSA